MGWKRGIERNFAWSDGRTMQCADDVLLSCGLGTCMVLQISVTPINSIKIFFKNFKKYFGQLSSSLCGKECKISNRTKQSMPLSNNTLDPPKSQFSILHAFRTIKDQHSHTITNAVDTSIPKWIKQIKWWHWENGILSKIIQKKEKTLQKIWTEVWQEGGSSGRRHSFQIRLFSLPSYSGFFWRLMPMGDLERNVFFFLRPHP